MVYCKIRIVYNQAIGNSFYACVPQMLRHKPETFRRNSRVACAYNIHITLNFTCFSVETVGVNSCSCSETKPKFIQCRRRRKKFLKRRGDKLLICVNGGKFFTVPCSAQHKTDVFGSVSGCIYNSERHRVKIGGKCRNAYK
jgi:hypothetical protein